MPVWWLPAAKETRFNRRMCSERAGMYITATGQCLEGELSRTGRAIVGTSLIGAKGATPHDQEAIDDTVAGVCGGAGVWTQGECLAHDQKTAKMLRPGQRSSPPRQKCRARPLPQGGNRRDLKKQMASLTEPQDETRRSEFGILETSLLQRRQCSQ